MPKSFSEFFICKGRNGSAGIIIYVTFFAQKHKTNVNGYPDFVQKNLSWIRKSKLRIRLEEDG